MSEADRRPLAERALPNLLEQPSPLFALLDAARDGEVLRWLQQAHVRHQSLYEGPEGEHLAEVAPYLVELGDDHVQAASLARAGWGSAWGVFLTSTATFAQVRRHFRRFLLVGLDDETVLFRFYDPRVLRALLPFCTAEQQRVVFGDHVEQFLMEDEDGGVLTFSNRFREAPRPGRVRPLLRFTREQADRVALCGSGMVQFLARHLRETTPELLVGMDHEGLCALCELGLERARGHALETVEDLTVFVSLMFQVAPNFDQHPEIARHLAKSRVQALAEALEGVPDSAWSEARARYDSESWLAGEDSWVEGVRV